MSADDMVIYCCGEVVPMRPAQADLAHVTLDRVALALAHIHRFNGQFGPASVAAHSLRVADLVPREYRLAALWHDAGECVTGDVPRSLKCAGYAEQISDVEDDFAEAMAIHLFGAELGVETCSRTHHREVKRADALDCERRLPLLRARLVAQGGWVMHRPFDEAQDWADAVRREVIEWMT